MTGCHKVVTFSFMKTYSLRNWGMDNHNICNLTMRHPLLLSIFLIAFMVSCGSRQENSKASGTETDSSDARISQIDVEVEAIEQQLDQWQNRRVAVEEGPGFTETQGYYDSEQPIKILRTEAGGHGSLVKSFYLKNGELFFVLEQVFSEASIQGPFTNQETRMYIAGEEVITMLTKEITFNEGEPDMSQIPNKNITDQTTNKAEILRQHKSALSESTSWLEDNKKAEFQVETVEFTETVDEQYVSRLPRLFSETPVAQSIVEEVNMIILDQFMIESFDPDEQEEFRWYEVRFTHEINKGILFISYTGEYYGAYLSQVEEELFFDLTTGQLLPSSEVPFQALFTLAGYLDFMNEYWLELARPAFEEAIACADIDPYCSHYDIGEYSVSNDSISLALVDDCYPRVVMACAPFVELKLSLAEIKPYLNDHGVELLLSETQTTKKGVDKFLRDQSIAGAMDMNAFYLFGKIDDAHAFSMALQTEINSNRIRGYYYYDSQLAKIELNGVQEDEMIRLDETVNDEKTGTFTLNFSQEYQEEAYVMYDDYGNGIYITGTWSNADGSKQFDVSFNEVKMNE